MSDETEYDRTLYYENTPVLGNTCPPEHQAEYDLEEMKEFKHGYSDHQKLRLPDVRRKFAGRRIKVKRYLRVDVSDYRFLGRSGRARLSFEFLTEDEVSWWYGSTGKGKNTDIVFPFGSEAYHVCLNYVTGAMHPHVFADWLEEQGIVTINRKREKLQ